MRIGQGFPCRCIPHSVPTPKLPSQWGWVPDGVGTRWGTSQRGGWLGVEPYPRTARTARDALGVL